MAATRNGAFMVNAGQSELAPFTLSEALRDAAVNWLVAGSRPSKSADDAGFADLSASSDTQIFCLTGIDGILRCKRLHKVPSRPFLLPRPYGVSVPGGRSLRFISIPRRTKMRRNRNFRPIYAAAGVVAV